jgi:O-antigen ligase
VQSERAPPTSRRKKAKSASLPEPVESGRGPELLRRALLGLATALILVRALVPGEDVGLLDPGANPIGLAVPLLWLCGLVTWAAWRIWSGQLAWYGGLVEAGLLGVVLLSFIGTATVASYQHPAWVVSWEWVGLLAAFFLVRQIARTAAEQRGLLAVLLATGVCLAVQSLWQHVLPDRGRAPLPGLTADELPRLRCQTLAALGNAPQNAFPANLGLPALVLATSDRYPTVFERVAVKNNVYLETGEPALPLALRPMPPQPPAATFGSLTNLAGCLALLLPALVGCVAAAWLGGAPRWQFGAAVGCALLTALALALTQVRSAILPCLLVGAAASALAWRHYSSRPPGSAGPPPRLLLLLALGGPAVLLVLAFALSPGAGQRFGDLTREWSAAWAMIHDHIALGVGAGNYVRHYPQYMAPTAPAVVSQPGNFVLEVWATLGLLAVVALAIALVSFFRRTLPVAFGPSQEVEDEGEATRWEFYEGGMIGLLVGFVLRALPLSGEAITAEALAAAARAVVWFAAFALLHGVRWTGTTRVLAGTAGVAVLLLHLAFAGGISVPGVAQPMWIMAALALNGLPEASLPVGRHLLWRVLPLVLTAAAALMCGLQLFQPLTSAAADNRAGLATAQVYLDLRSGVTPSRDDGKTERIASPPRALLRITDRLASAVEADPGNARYWADMANWYGEFYDLTGDDVTRQRGVRYAYVAQAHDPRGEEGYLAEARLHHLGAVRAPTPQLRKKAASDIPKPLLKIIQHRPNDPQLHYQLAAALFEAGDRNLGRVHAARALELDGLAATPTRRLSDAQREQARRLAETSAARPPLP